jgi:hypothetical protein
VDFLANCTSLWLDSMRVTRPMSMLRLGTHRGQFSRNVPSSTSTPSTMGSFLLNTYCGITHIVLVRNIIHISQEHHRGYLGQDLQHAREDHHIHCLGLLDLGDE